EALVPRRDCARAAGGAGCAVDSRTRGGRHLGRGRAGGQCHRHGRGPAPAGAGAHAGRWRVLAGAARTGELPGARGAHGVRAGYLAGGGDGGGRGRAGGAQDLHGAGRADAAHRDRAPGTAPGGVAGDVRLLRPREAGARPLPQARPLREAEGEPAHHHPGRGAGNPALPGPQRQPVRHLHPRAVQRRVLAGADRRGRHVPAHLHHGRHPRLGGVAEQRRGHAERPGGAGAHRGDGGVRERGPAPGRVQRQRRVVRGHRDLDAPRLL
ncbi:MAG: hypothetical protein AVDCRST_MAG68-5660, partial [uncultured Gemmatimonadetes bacterium]